MPERKDVLAEKRHVTGKISDNCRFIGFGLLAVYYAIMSGAGTSFGASLRLEHPYAVQLIGMSGVLTILFDYLQFLFASRSVDQALKRSDNSYNSKSLAYKARSSFYYAKQWSTFIGAATLVYIVGATALRSF